MVRRNGIENERSQGEREEKKAGKNWRRTRDRNGEKHWPANTRTPASSPVAPPPEQTDRRTERNRGGKTERSQKGD